MIEQVLYRRTIDRGYIEYSSGGLSKEEAHDVNVIMEAMSASIGDLGSGADSPFIVYPFEQMGKVCLARFQREFSKGRSNSVNHGILIDAKEYYELSKAPERLWGFTNKNFLSTRVNSRNEMISLKQLDSADNQELNKDYIFREYNLNNDGFLTFLTALYTSLSKDKGYTCGITIDSSKNANRVMRHMGYLIMCMLPYDLRDKISFSSRPVPRHVNITLQIVNEGNFSQADMCYKLDSGEYSCNKEGVELTDFYLSDLLDMTDGELRNYFAAVDAFKDDLNLAEGSEESYVISKLLKLSQKPELFKNEPADEQLTFINDVFALKTDNTDFINSIVVALLPYVDPERYMETFDINFELFVNLDPQKEADRRILPQIEENLLKNYARATSQEKATLFVKAYGFDKKAISADSLTARMIEENDLQTDKLLLETYITLYEETYIHDLTEVFYSKIETVFRAGDISLRKQIWEKFYNSDYKTAAETFMYNILQEEDEPFQKEIFDMLVKLFDRIDNVEYKALCHDRITDVINQEDDAFLLQVLYRYNDTFGDVEDCVWVNAYDAIKGKQNLKDNKEFMDCLKKKYYASSHPQVKDLYLEYLAELPISDLESNIRIINKKMDKNQRDKDLLREIFNILIKGEHKVSESTLQALCSAVDDDCINDLAVYINKVYLCETSDSTTRLYTYLEEEHQKIFCSGYLDKESLPSFDRYCASKLNYKVIEEEKVLVETVDYLTRNAYHSESFEKLYSIFADYIKENMSASALDYDRFQKYKAFDRKIHAVQYTEFGNAYCHKLEDLARSRFWDNSNINTFDYHHHQMYRSQSEVYSNQYSTHENHILAEQIEGIFNGYGVDWDRACDVFLTSKYISNKNARAKLASGFLKMYREKALSTKDPEYIAFSIFYKNLKLNSATFRELKGKLEKANRPADKLAVKGLTVINYLSNSNEIDKYFDRTSSDVGADRKLEYYEIMQYLLVGQIIVAVLLIINSLALNHVCNMYGNKIPLMFNYILFVVLMVATAAMTLYLTLKTNEGWDDSYDIVYLALLVNLICSAGAILLSVLQFNFLVCLIGSIVLLAAAIIFNLIKMR